MMTRIRSGRDRSVSCSNRIRYRVPIAAAASTSGSGGRLVLLGCVSVICGS